MEGLVLDAITHAVLAVRRRREGQTLVAERHRAASRRYLLMMLTACAQGAGGRE